MEELQVRVLEGRWGPQVEYALRYPQSAGGRSAFDRFWRQTVQRLQRQACREPGRFPTAIAAEWQETRRDSLFCSGFLDVSRKVGHGDWTLWRISATFGPGTGGPIPLRQLLGPDWQKPLHRPVLQRLEQAAGGETPFFRGWQRRAGTLLAGGRYYLTDQGLCLWFPQETLGPKNAGLPTVILPYDSLDILRRLC